MGLVGRAARQVGAVSSTRHGLTRRAHRPRHGLTRHGSHRLGRCACQTLTAEAGFSRPPTLGVQVTKLGFRGHRRWGSRSRSWGSEATDAESPRSQPIVTTALWVPASLSTCRELPNEWPGRTPATGYPGGRAITFRLRPSRGSTTGGVNHGRSHQHGDESHDHGAQTKDIDRRRIGEGQERDDSTSENHAANAVDHPRGARSGTAD